VLYEVFLLLTVLHSFVHGKEAKPERPDKYIHIVSLGHDLRMSLLTTATSKHVSCTNPSVYHFEADRMRALRVGWFIMADQRGDRDITILWSVH
jgi:hypothetical protein